jgi:hypothetical protein
MNPLQVMGSWHQFLLVVRTARSCKTSTVFSVWHIPGAVALYPSSSLNTLDQGLWQVCHQWEPQLGLMDTTVGEHGKPPALLY